MPELAVTINNVVLGNRLPLAVIAGPCRMESRAHDLEMAAALKAIAARVDFGLIYGVVPLGEFWGFVCRLLAIDGLVKKFAGAA